jgi:hypothetical protein
MKRKLTGSIVSTYFMERFGSKIKIRVKIITSDLIAIRNIFKEDDIAGIVNL